MQVLWQGAKAAPEYGKMLWLPLPKPGSWDSCICVLIPGLAGNPWAAA